MIRIFSACVLLLCLVFASPPAEAFVDDPTVSPTHPTPSTPITVLVRTGGCHFFIESENAPELVRVGNHLDLIADGVSLPEGHPFCIGDTGTARFDIGTLPLGAYTLRILIRDIAFPETPVAFGTVAFSVSNSFTIPSSSAESMALMIATLLLVGGLVARARSSSLLALAGLVVLGFAVSSGPVGAQDKVLHVLLSADQNAPTAESIVDGYDFAAGGPPPLIGTLR